MNQQKPERGRFVADGEKVILLHDDGRIEGVERRPKPSDGGDFVYMKLETTYGTPKPPLGGISGIREFSWSLETPLTKEAEEVLRRHIEEAKRRGDGCGFDIGPFLND